MPPKTSALDKKVPQNPKYANVESRLSSGGAQSKSAAPVSAQAVSKRRDEVFKRIKCSTLARLIRDSEVAESIYGLAEGDDECDDRSSVRASVAASQSVAPTAASSVTVAGSVLSVVQTDAETVDGMKDHVVYDLREAEDFNSHHITTALSYPATLLNRDKITPELYKLKSSEKILVVYHKDDSLGAPVATQLVQRGWENVYLLSGGLDDFAEGYPELIDGDVPARPKTGMSAVSGRASSGAGSRR